MAYGRSDIKRIFGPANIESYLQSKFGVNAFRYHPESRFLPRSLNPVIHTDVHCHLSNVISKRLTPRATDPTREIVEGVLFDVPQSWVCCLDRAEGEGTDYDRGVVWVAISNAQLLPAETYIVKEAKIDQGAKPYDWYLDLVITGAVMHELPQTYIEALRKVQTCPDPDLKRFGRVESLKQLGKSASSCLNAPRITIETIEQRKKRSGFGLLTPN